MIGAIASRRPLVVIVDDIHVAAPTFLELLDHLVDAVSGATILILASARHELFDAREEWAEAQRFFKFVPRVTGGYDFQKLEEYDALWSRARVTTNAIEPALGKAISPIVAMTSQEAELFGTVHSAGN